VERLWRSLKYEEVYLHAYNSPLEARLGIGRYLNSSTMTGHIKGWIQYTAEVYEQRKSSARLAIHAGTQPIAASRGTRASPQGMLPPGPGWRLSACAAWARQADHI